MRKTTRYLAVVLAMGMTLPTVLAGCGSTAPAQATTEGTETTSQTADDSSAVSQNGPTDTESAEDDNVIKHWINNEGYVVYVDVNPGDYQTAEDPVDAPEKLNADMRANLIMSDFPAECGKTQLNHPNGIASDGKHLVLCDTWNNRVLIWNSLPTGNTQADVVLGQKDFESFTAGIGMDQVNWPVAVTFAGEKLIVADTNNNRLLVWDSVPTENGAAADHVITSVNAENDLMWPWEVWSDGKKLIATSTEAGQVAFWDDVESAIAGETADQVINTGGTPRTVISDGDYLLIGDHNLGWSGDGYQMGSQGSHVWRTYPNDGRDADFHIDLQLGGAIIDGDLYGSAQNDESFHIYDGLIDSADQTAATILNTDLEYFRNGDYNKMLYIDGKTYIPYYNSGFVAIYDGKVTKDNYMEPSGFIGADENVRSMSVLRSQYQNPASASDGTSLVFIDDYNGLICIYKTIPDTDHAIPDLVYHFPPEWDSPIDVAVDKQGRMMVLTDSSLLIWNQIPLTGDLYDKRIEFEHCIGRERSRIETCDEGFFLYSEVDEQLFKLPLSDAAGSFENAINQVDAPYISGLTCDGTYLMAAKEEEGKVTVYNVSDLSVYGEVFSTSHIHREGFHPDFEIVKDAILLPNGQFLAADNNEIRIWDSLDAAIADREFEQCSSMGMLDNYPVYTKYEGTVRDEFHSIATDGSIFKPTYLAYSNGHLWVGEFKFSSRLLRYDIKYDSNEEAKAEATETASGDIAEEEASTGSPEYDQLVSQTIGINSPMTLSADADATIDAPILKDFTIDCDGHNLKISGRIYLEAGDNQTLTIVNPGKVDLGNLTFEKPGDISVGGDTDYLLMIKGENLEITPPADVPAGSRKEGSKGFYCETKDTSVSIRYRGQ